MYKDSIPPQLSSERDVSNSVERVCLLQNEVRYNFNAFTYNIKKKQNTISLQTEGREQWPLRSQIVKKGPSKKKCVSLQIKAIHCDSS